MILWDVLIEIKNKLAQRTTLPKAIAVGFKSGLKITFEPNEESEFIIHVHGSSVDPFRKDFIEIERNGGLVINGRELDLFKLYFPYTCLNFFGKKRKKTFAISHFAQTLDGRIASFTGDSKWIGNEENLVHAHRMRALCDAILVGAKTIERDNPRLNVRKVAGSDPVKVVIGGNGQFSKQHFHAIGPRTIVFKDHKVKGEIFDCVVIPKEPDYDLTNVLEILARKGIYSVYVEGGAYTTSSFLKQKALDQVQLHFSNRILGSGTSSFLVDGIAEVKEAITFKSSQYVPMGNEMMFVGNVG